MLAPEPHPSYHRAASLGEYLAVLRRRKLIVTAVPLVLLTAAIVLSLSQTARYEAKAEVLLSRQNLAAMLTNTQDPASMVAAERFAETQSQVASVPAVAQRVLAETGVRRLTPNEFLERSSVTARRNSDVLIFAVEGRTAQEARTLATSYARQYTEYRTELDTAALSLAREEVRTSLEQLRDRGEGDGELARDLEATDQELSTLETLQTSNAFVIRPADEATKTRPQPLRNAVVSLVLGLVLGVGLAFVREALDTRVRSGAAVSNALDLPILGFVPPPPRDLEREEKLVMLESPQSVNAEAFRVLRVSLGLARMDRQGRLIVLTSAVQGEGKSLTIGNLAVALARNGQRVALVDLDLRRPRLASLFRLGGPGVTEVTAGDVPLEGALVPVALGDSSGSNGAGERAASNGKDHGLLHVLPAGVHAPAPAELLSGGAVAGLLERLSERYDTVLLDSPPILHAGDAIALSTRADALIFLSRPEKLRTPMLAEVRRLLDATPVTKLGVVIAGDQDDTGPAGYYRYGYAADEQSESLLRSILRRAPAGVGR